MTRCFNSPIAKALVVVLLSSILPPGVARASTDSSPTAKRDGQSKKAGSKEKNQHSSAEAGATSTSTLALPFKRSWQHLTDSATAISPTLDNSRIYLPLDGGRVLCLSRETGALLWSSEPGGRISAPVIASENSVFVATRKLADDGSEAGGSLRAVDKSTGLTVWLHDYARSFTSPLALAGSRIFVGSSDGFFYAIDSKNGDVVWRVETQDVVRGHALITDRSVLFGSDDGALRAVEPERGQLLWKHQTGGKIIGQPATDGGALYFGSGDSYVYAVDLGSGQLRWRARTGAAIEAPPVIVGERLLVASYDNFVYALSRGSGDRIWKRRLENRITAAPIVEGDANLVAPLRSDYVAVFLNADGRRVNLYQLEPDFEIIAEPIFSGDTLVLPTDKGLIVAAATRLGEPQTNAIRK